ncbi:MAG: DUF2232 domain-containing protein [Gammaproteobacteria bacterium]
MKALGNYILGGRLQSAAIISLMTVLSLLLPPFSYIISGAPFSLLTLRKGPHEGILVLFMVLVLTSLFGYFTNIGPVLGIAFTAGIWLPLWLCSIVLRISESQGTAMLAVAAIGVALVIFTSSFNDELVAWWQTWVDAFLAQNFTASENARMQELFDMTLPLLGGIISAGIIISLTITLLLARWWQSSLFNPGGFRDEFQRLLLPKWLTLVTLCCLLISMLDASGLVLLVRNILLVLIVVHMFQGIASVHRVVYNRKLSRAWLVTMYGFLVFLPQMALFVACIGMVDAWRRNIKSLPPGTD